MRRRIALLFAATWLWTSGSGCTETGDDPLVIEAPDASPDEGFAPDNGPLPDLSVPDVGPDMMADAAPPPAREAINPLPPLDDWDDETLAVLDPVVAEADVVALGEATHGSGGLHRARAHLIRRLVTVHGARSIYFESPWVMARAADDYARSCAGRAEDATASLFYYIWFDAAIRDTLAWVCAYNAEHPDDPVRVGGFDVQNPFDDVSALEVWLPVLTDDAEAIIAALRRCPDAAFDDVHDAIARPEGDMTDVAACMDGLGQLDGVLDGAQPGAETDATRLAATSLAAWLDVSTSGGGAGAFTARDTGMADLFEAQWSGDAPGILYLANSHASRNHPQVMGARNAPYAVQGGTSAGTALAERFGERYVAIATTAGVLQTNRRGTGTVNRNDGEATLARALAAAGVDAPAVAVDLGAGDAMWSELTVGMVMFGGLRQLVLGEQFDAVIALDTSGPMYDAVAAAYDGPYRDELDAFESVFDDAYSQAQGGYVGAFFIADSGWQLIARYRQNTPPPVGEAFDLAGSNALEFIVAIDGRYWFGVSGTITVTEDGGAGGRFSVTGEDVVFWPLFRNSWVMPGPEAIHIGRFAVSSTRGG